MFWLGLSLPIAYWPSVTDSFILTGWIIISCTMPFFLLRPQPLGPAHWLGLCFLLYATASLLWTPIWQQGIWDLWLLYLLASGFLLGASYEIKPFFIGLACGLGVNSCLLIPQFFGWQGVYESNFGAPAGLFVNPDIMGESAALATIGLVLLGVRWPLIFTLPCLVLSEARVAWVACLVCLALWLWERFRWRAFALVVVLPFALVKYDAPLTWQGTTGGMAERIAIWRDTAEGLTFFGRGAGSFFTEYPRFAKRTDTMKSRPESAHNDFLELVFEFGLGTLPLFALLTWALAMPFNERYLVLALCVVALGSFPIRIPTEGFVGMVALGALCGRRALARAERASRRSFSNPWPRSTGREAISVEPLSPHLAGV